MAQSQQFDELNQDGVTSYKPDTQDLVELIQEADFALVQMEQARVQMDLAKLNFEMAKDELEQRREAFDHVIAKADEFGVSRAKLKKLSEERSAALMASGLLSLPANGSRSPKAAKAPRKPKAVKLVEPEADTPPASELI